VHTRRFVIRQVHFSQIPRHAIACSYAGTANALWVRLIGFIRRECLDFLIPLRMMAMLHADAAGIDIGTEAIFVAAST
jgi:hypothetical protein